MDVFDNTFMVFLIIISIWELFLLKSSRGTSLALIVMNVFPKQETISKFSCWVVKFFLKNNITNLSMSSKVYGIFGTGKLAQALIRGILHKSMCILFYFISRKLLLLNFCTVYLYEMTYAFIFSPDWRNLSDWLYFFHTSPILFFSLLYK